MAKYLLEDMPSDPQTGDVVLVLARPKQEDFGIAVRDGCWLQLNGYKAGDYLCRSGCREDAPTERIAMTVEYAVAGGAVLSFKNECVMFEFECSIDRQGDTFIHIEWMTCYEPFSVEPKNG